ncbi:AAA family ATPase [Desertifilum sp. FACHB-1129]|uniref:ATPase n=1 Tax=Desertifilum tharense IPPAS B-1220 TaxID=1781255 RepID=A0A1E5QQU3_9CYAN|nr:MULTISPECIES: ATP-binding protein [Desertifilum]MDA0213460.1 AAA family ATPase [Cyanobacteria bacterium FC1]MBD2314386.1 AAA family ATPase [Desertifilum sp. FACHB-1129]MBD2323319.1 AAA family ATPase [Desertifilum sp. FACHB-866]MBD2333164.1 AAA family ATPase [Desertifilum sp. FACHB-868]OEJ76991.1 ATPase [Desertifilum tharense IPPAS B-1220]
MLKQLTLTNWKSFRHAQLPLDPLTVLIGTNASGKSNAIEALEFLKRVALGQDFKTALMGDSTISGVRGGAEWAAYQSEHYFELEVVVQGENPNIDYLYTLTVQTKPVVQLSGEGIRRNQYDPLNPQLFQPLINTERQEDSSTIDVLVHLEPYEHWQHSWNRSHSIILTQATGFYHDIEGLDIVSRAIKNILVLDPVSNKMREYSPLSEEIQRDGSNIAGVLATLSEEEKVKVESALSSYVKYLPEGDIQRVWAEKVGRFGTDAMLYCEELWKGDRTTEGSPNPRTLEIDARGMSDGTLRFLAILTALLTRPEGSQLVIEEVDNGLHPSRAELLLKMLREIGEQRKIDLLVTTHNPALLDALGPEMVPFVVVAHRDINGDSQLTLLEEIENLPKLMASGTLGKLTTKGAIERSLSHPR